MGIAGLSLLSSIAVAGNTAPSWTMGGHDLSNTRSQPQEQFLGVKNAAKLATDWTFTTGGNVSATPAVSATTVYFPDYAGNLFAVNRKTGAPVWTASISAATGIPNDYARAAPLLANGLVIVGNQGGRFATPSTPAAQAGAWLLAFNATTGALVWKTQVETAFPAIITQGAVFYNGPTAVSTAAATTGTVYVGVASNEEAFANKAFNGGIPYSCCSFRGSLVALDVTTGAIKWQTYTVPQGYSGGGVWGSTPAIDPARGSIYITTGNNYSAPASVTSCVVAAEAAGTDPSVCADPNDHFDSILALDLNSGAIKWSFAAQPTDSYNVDCGLPGAYPGNTNTPSNCPPGQGPDYDFAQGPILFTATTGKNSEDLIGAGEKAGIFWALDRTTGKLVWKTTVGPGGFTGGMQWASATDGQRIYVAESNSTSLSAGYWAALDVATGAILWQTTDPGPGWVSTYGIFGFSAEGPVSVANGVVYACSLDPQGHMYAMNAATGQIVWSFASGGSCNAGAAIVDGEVYWGSGYQLFAPFTTNNNKFFAFKAPNY
jgi:polyvinyl alcohol dehydrogenase (cytochrome)